MNRTSLLLILPALAACATARPSSAPPAPESDATPLAFPELVVATGTTVLYAPEDPKVRLAFPRLELPLQVRQARGSEVFAEIDGPVRASGVAPLSSLGVVVCTPGPLGDHFYAGNGNLLALRSEVVNGRVKVAGAVHLRARPYSKDVPFSAQFRTVPFEAEIDASRLCSRLPPPRHAGTNEDPLRGHGYGEVDDEDFPKGTPFLDIPKDTPLALLDAPGGKVLHTLPADAYGFSVLRLEHQGGWDRVAAGGGPYLLGWIPARAPRKDHGGGGLLVGELATASDPRPEPRALDQPDLVKLPLYALPAGTPLTQFGVVRATLTRAGFGRVARVEGGFSFVIAAVDDDLTAEGWVETAKLGKQVP